MKPLIAILLLSALLVQPQRLNGQQATQQEAQQAFAKGDLQTAAVKYQQLLAEAQGASGGAASMYTFVALTGLGRVAERQKDLVIAEQYFKEAMRPDLGLPTELRGLGELALFYGRTGKARESAAAYAMIADRWGGVAGRNSLGVARYLMEKGAAESRGGFAAEAERTFRESLAILKNISADKTPVGYIVLGALGNTLATQGKPDEAAPLIAEAGAGLEKLMGRVPREVTLIIGSAVSKQTPEIPIQVLPAPLSMPQASYSDAARKARVAGSVSAVIAVSVSGSVENIWIIKPLGLELDERVIEAIRKWRFRPAMRDGTAVKTEILVDMNFSLY